ncbi:MAG: hypothetical protein M3Q97_09965, partial [Bacteroidota bacterium]|nr:hypothetical protein [Bacteroidota bacterium]
MITAIDVGNSLCKVGFFEDETLTDTLSFKVDKWTDIYSCLDSATLGDTIVSTVRDMPKHMERYFISKSKSFLKLDGNTPLPFPISYKTPESLGTD